MEDNDIIKTEVRYKRKELLNDKYRGSKYTGVSKIGKRWQEIIHAT